MTNKERNRIQQLLTGKSINAIVKHVCGELIAKGLYRDVYVLKSNPEYVVKIERDMSHAQFANVTEWRNYIDAREWEWFANWLAPCEMINQTGQVLIQRRVTPGKRKDYPKYVPAMFTDLKLQNFGWIGDRFVCCDYSFLKTALPTQKRKGSKYMQYAKWWTLNSKK